MGASVVISLREMFAACGASERYCDWTADCYAPMVRCHREQPIAMIEPHPNVVEFGEEVLDRMVRAAKAVESRQRRSTDALQGARLPHALCGSNATSAWITSVDESGVRQARNVELVLLRQDFVAATSALQAGGFVQASRDGQIRFLDGPEGRWRDAVEITFGGEQVSNKAAQFTTPSPTDVCLICGYNVLPLESLVTFQLARQRLDDLVDVRDMIDVGLLDRSWAARLPGELGTRLQELLDNPDG
jgi:hypothetical protein